MQATSLKRNPPARSEGSGAFLRGPFEDYERRTERECFQAVIPLAPDGIAQPAGTIHDGKIVEDFVSRTQFLLQMASVACFHPEGQSRLASVDQIGRYEAGEILTVIERAKYGDARDAAVRILEGKMERGTSLGTCPRSTSLIARLSSEPKARESALKHLAGNGFWGRSVPSSLMETALLTRYADTAAMAASMAADMYGADSFKRRYIKAMLAIGRPLVRALERFNSWVQSIRNPNNVDLHNEVNFG